MPKICHSCGLEITERMVQQRRFKEASDGTVSCMACFVISAMAKRKEEEASA